MATKKAAPETQQEEEETQQVAEFPLPAGYENQSVGFARAFEHAKRHGNPDKSSLLFAEAHFSSFEPTDV